MGITPGTSLGSYEVVDLIGRGGMGEVYRARDMKLGREVAIKALPGAFARDSDRLARFEREARLLASLNHPHIAVIHGLEEHDGTRFLVLELVEGPTLADRIREGAIPPEEALKLALQIAEALEAAHEKGVIHRDLKPANIKLTKDGQVKVLDFGLAKAYAGPDRDAGLSESPTLSMAATQQGLILGTAAYMSPEQARGQEVDHRTDIWAWGSVLYEMLTGRPAFPGSDVTDILAAVVRAEPEWAALPGDLHLRLRELLERCLEKDPRQRWHDIADVRVDLQRIVEEPAGRVRASPDVVAPSRRRLLPWTVAAVLGLAALAMFVIDSGPAIPPRLIQVPLPDGVFLPSDTNHAALDLSGDGRLLAFVGEEDGTRRLFLHDLETGVSRVLEGTEGAAAPFFHPDGNDIAFFTEDGLHRISTGSGVPVEIPGAYTYTVSRGATWLDTDPPAVADRIANVRSRGGGVIRLDADGSEPVPATDWIDRAVNLYAYPDRVPGSGGFLINDIPRGGLAEAEILWMAADTGETRSLFTGGTHPRYSPTGHIVYGRSGALYARGFDATVLSVDDAEHLLVASVLTDVEGAVQYAVGGNATLAYVEANAAATPRFELVWVDRRGNVLEAIRSDTRRMRWPRLSFDGAMIAGEVVRGNNSDIFMFDLNRNLFDVVTTDLGEDFGPVWGPGRGLAFASEMDEDPESPGPELAWIPPSGGGPQVLKQAPGDPTFDFPSSWSPDGGALAVSANRQGNVSIVLLDTETLEFSEFVATPTAELSAMFSPGGEWVAYVSDHSGAFEIYVKPVRSSNTGHSDATRLSTDGGVEPIWSRDGGELYYWEANRFMVVTFGDGYDDPGPAEPLFTRSFERSPAGLGAYTANYDVSLDGERFLMVQNVNPIRPTVINVIRNWPDLLGIPQ